MRIIVTGGAGFIGSNVVDEYIDAGHDVAIIDNLSTGELGNVNPRARFYKIDIRSEEVKDVFERERPEVVNCHAAQISVPYSIANPVFDADVNILGFLNVTEAARLCGAKKMIFISSGGAIYGEAEEYPTGENASLNPVSPYAISKGVCEKYLDFYGSHYGISCAILRYANIYGPRQIPKSEAGVVSIFMDNLIKGIPSTLNHYDGEPRGMQRDYCFVGDVKKANLTALANNSGVFNIGTGVATHTEDLYSWIYKAMKKMVPGMSDALASPKKAPARPGDLKRSCLDVTKSAKLLGWRPSVDLEKGIELTVKWRLEKESYEKL